MASQLDVDSVAGDLEDAGKKIRELNGSGEPGASDQITEIAEWIAERCAQLVDIVDQMQPTASPGLGAEPAANDDVLGQE